MTVGVSQDLISTGLVGAYEIRELLGGISRQRVYQITTHADFPRPLANLAQGKVWSASEVSAWRARRRR
jgi:prophage regulatory protein